FETLRLGNLEVLAGFELGEAELDLTGIHPEFGAVTLRQLLATWVTHDLSHLSQIARVMAKRHGEDVGPWRKYLSVLSR
ncbi:DinB family protein, partial [Gemmatimonadota bacterium]